MATGARVSSRPAKNPLEEFEQCGCASLRGSAAVANIELSSSLRNVTTKNPSIPVIT
jgi:hypothetical protein